MKFRSQTQTALRALLDLCLYSVPQQPISLAEIARRQGLSAAFLEQLFRKLKAGGIVSPSRGVKGGYVLSKPADQLSLRQVFEALADPMIKAAKAGPSGDKAEAQVVREALEESAAAFHGKLALISLADLKRRALSHPGMRGAPKAGLAVGL